MKVHRETIDLLIRLYADGHQILDDEYDADKEGEDAREAAAIDYLTSTEKSRFCGIFDNLDIEVQCELFALMQLGREPGKLSHGDFEMLKQSAATDESLGDLLFGTKDLPAYWTDALKRLNVG